jgi:alpha-galactosidase
MALLFFAAAVLAEAHELFLPNFGQRDVVRIKPTDAKKCELSFCVPISDIQQMWTPDMQMPFLERKWWISKMSAPQSSMPCIAWFNMAERNSFFFGAAALEWDCRIESKINQERGVYEVKFTAATGSGVLKSFDVTLDRRDVPWTQTVGEWRNSLPYARGSYPAAAWEPAFCSWYAVHAAIDAQWVERTAAIAAELGFGTFILDDGWSYDEAKRVSPETIKTWYRDVGAWDAFSSVKFPDFRRHRERMRELGLNYVVWVAPYFLGTRSAAFRRWGYDNMPDAKVVEGNVLTDIENKAMMESVTEQLVRLMRDSGVDGLKIDFLDYVRPSVDTPHGVRTLEYVRDLMKRLREVKPDGVFEFRQGYATPMTASLATQFRAGDVPFEWQANLLRIAQIRLTMGDGVPIHSDPIYWADSETDDNIARHFMAAMAGVPMLSMDLEKMSPERRASVRRWMRLYREKVAPFQRNGKWGVFYRNGGLVGLVGKLPGTSLVIVNNPAGFAMLRATAGNGAMTVFNLGFESLPIPDGEVIAPATIRDM